MEMLGDDAAAVVAAEDAAVVAVAAADAVAVSVAAAAVPPPAGVKLTYKQERALLRQKIHRFIAPEPLKISDDATFLQIAIACQNRRGTTIDFQGLSGADALRSVLPEGTDLGRGNLGLYRASLAFLEANDNLP